MFSALVLVSIVLIVTAAVRAWRSVCAAAADGASWP
jgi:hypothetical protein